MLVLKNLYGFMLLYRPKKKCVTTSRFTTLWHSLRGDDFALRPCMMCNSESAIKTFCFIVKFFRLFSYHLKRSILDIDFRMSNPISTRF